MLNEERVKHMTKMAFYETKGGAEDMRIGSYYKKDYIGSNSFWAGFWMTVAYVALVIILVTGFLLNGLKDLQSKQLMIIAFSFLGIYFVLLFAYISFLKKTYKRRHAVAYHRMRRFKDELEQLEKLYEKEENHE